MKPLPPQHLCEECRSSHYTREGRALLNKHHTTCVHCKDPVYYSFAVTESVWREAGLDYHEGVVHLECLEAMLDRQLEMEEFVPALSGGKGHSINDAIRWAYQRSKGSPSGHGIDND